MRALFLGLFGALFASVTAQTVTVEDENGMTVVEVLTTDADGDPSTRTLRTLTDTTTTTDTDTATTTATRTTTTSTTPVGGPQATPDATTGTPHTPIEYQYTTTVDGEVTVLNSVFTPTFAETTPVTAPATGTILSWEEYTSIYKITQGATGGGSAADGAPPRLISTAALSALAGASLIGLTLVL
ncbi:hypothetical protein CYLTODRAFT_493443 [Cylindrobasidium torrendii FP15055 ss-10]|uniref:Uncharacterized protein n=1 Tax=Cylindrobasidium torrendii FP15055 ss-10 TaxID=1314674 RepID=A0A0D7B3C8_9AGAR|nr:hypothetical protein CYLTODRAFT_493443 [Cylindrobasidium torrendii FP15055 ss-10]